MRIILLAAMTLDGFIGRDSAHYPDWTEKADMRFFVERTKQAGVVIMGATTFATINRPLPGRKVYVLSRDETKRPDIEQHNNVFLWTDTPRALVAHLAKGGQDEAVLAGGTQIYSAFARENLIDEMIVSIAPVLFGSGLRVFEAGIMPTVRLDETVRFGDNSVRLHYTVLP